MSAPADLVEDLSILYGELPADCVRGLLVTWTYHVPVRHRLSVRRPVTGDMRSATVADRADGWGAPRALTGVEQLQRTAGNRAVTMFLQRQVVVGVVLTPAQMATARRFYAARARRYSASLIRDMQTVVGVPPTGVVDDETIKHIASKQDEFGPPLEPDGMAGSRTLARFFPTGLADKATTERFVVSVKGATLDHAEWSKLTTPQARAERLVDLASVQLASARVGVAPTALAVVTGPRAQTRNNRQPPLWQIQLHIKSNRLDQATLSATQARSVATDVYHEARHIEQLHKMARMFAGTGKSAAWIAGKLNIPDDVAADAHDDPLKPGSSEFLIAEDQAESLVGSGKAQTERVEVEAIAAEKALAVAQERRDADPSPANEAVLQRAKERREMARIAHNALAIETDAIGTEQPVFNNFFTP